MELPEFLQDATYETILATLLAQVPDDVDKSQGSFIYDALSPVAVELTEAAIWAQEVLRRGFAQTTFGTYLDLRCAEHGVYRRPAAKSVGYVTFRGDPGTGIPEGTIISTPSSELAPAVFFVTTMQGIIGDAGEVTIPIEAVEEGASGNVVVGAISVLGTPLQGVASVINEQPTTGGADVESDESLLNRFLEWVRNPSASGNKADYIRWAMEVPGVGAVSVVPLKYGNGTVSVALVDEEMNPADEVLLGRVREYIAPPWHIDYEAEALTISGYGVTINSGQVVMAYSSSGSGMVKHVRFDSLFSQPGTWQVIVYSAVVGAGVNDLLKVGVWNSTQNAWAKKDVSSTEDAFTVFSADDINASREVYQQFFWNGQDHLELRIERLQTDTVNTVTIDKIAYESLFSKDTGDGKAPIGARVYIEPASPVAINVSVHLVVATGYEVGAVQLAVKENVEQYLKSLTFMQDNDVRYVKIGSVILDTPGVVEYSNLLVNGATNNIPIGEQEVAVLGTVTFT